MAEDRRTPDQGAARQRELDAQVEELTRQIADLVNSAGVESRQHLREYAHLDREVMVAGGFDHIEIWDAQMFGERDAAGIASIEEGEGINDFL